jgi:Flp pilus assembly pilin Flp
MLTYRKDSAMRSSLFRFCADESGATALEYAFIGSLISIVVFTATKYMGLWAVQTFQEVGDNLVSS